MTGVLGLHQSLQAVARIRLFFHVEIIIAKTPNLLLIKHIFSPRNDRQILFFIVLLFSL